MAIFANAQSAIMFAITLSFTMLLIAVFCGGMVDELYSANLKLEGSETEYAGTMQLGLFSALNMFHAILVGISLFGWGVALQSAFAKDSGSRYIR